MFILGRERKNFPEIVTTWFQNSEEDPKNPVFWQIFRKIHKNFEKRDGNLTVEGFNPAASWQLTVVIADICIR